MGVKRAEMTDLIATTLDDLPKGEFEMMFDNQNYEFNTIYEKSRRKIDGGKAITRNVVLDEQGNARYRRAFDSDEPSVDSIHKTITVPWTQLGTDYSWDVTEILQNRNSPAGFIDMVESRRSERLWGFAELFEDRGWKTPESATDDLNPYGVPYYINKLNSGVTTAGFSGQTIRYQDASTGTTCAGIDASTESKWRNYAATYTKVDNAFLRTLRTAVLKTRFRPPAFVQNRTMTERGPMTKMYAGIDLVTELMDLADQRDDSNTPKDLAGRNLVDVEGSIYFNRFPICYVPPLDSDGDDPIYCIDWSKFQPIVQDGYWMEESEPFMDRSQHTAVTVFLDGMHQNLVINRRTAGFVVHKVTSA